MQPLKYLKQELNFSASDWVALSTEDKETLKRWAREEMIFLGITVE